MKDYQLAAKRRQSQQQQAAQVTQQSAAQGSVTDQQQQNQPQNKGVQFTQIMPEIQQKVNEHTFFYPPAMIKGTRQAEDWLIEANARFGLSLQRLQIARSKRAAVKRHSPSRHGRYHEHHNDVLDNHLKRSTSILSDAFNLSHPKVTNT